MPKLTKEQKLATKFYRTLRKLDSEAPEKFKKVLKETNRTRVGLEKTDTLAKTLVAYQKRGERARHYTTCREIIIYVIDWSCRNEMAYWCNLSTRLEAA